MPEKDMTWYFDRGLERGALLLDGANLDKGAFPLFSAYKDELAEIAAERGPELGYSYPGGKKELRQLIAERESALEGVPLGPESVVVNSGGCSGTFDNLFRVLSRRARTDGRSKMIVPTPTYPEIIKSLKYNGLEHIPLETSFERGFQPSPEEIATLSGKDVACIFLVTPGNPACRYLPREDLEEIAGIAKRGGAVLAVDQIFEESPLAERTVESFKASGNYPLLVKLKGFSKDRPQLNDLRLGWSVCLDPALNAELTEAGEVSDYSNSTITERLAIADMRLRNALGKGGSYPGLSQGDLERYSAELTRYQRKVGEGVKGALEILSASPAIEKFVVPQAGNVIYAKAKGGARGIQSDHELFVSILEGENILVSPGSIYGSPGGDLWYRTTMSIEPEKFLEGTRKVVRHLENLGRN